MRRRTVPLSLLLGPLLVAGCLSEGGPSAVAPADAGAPDGTAAPQSILSVAHEGQTGARGCVFTPLTLNCPVAQGGSGDSYVFDCGEQNAAWVRGNLTWTASEAPPLAFSVTIAHHPPDDDHWQAEPEAGAEGTGGRIEIDADFSTYLGDVVSMHVLAWYVVGNDMAGILLTQGEDFDFEGTLGCAG